jgi:hypothetical protein
VGAVVSVVFPSVYVFMWVVVLRVGCRRPAGDYAVFVLAGRRISSSSRRERVGRPIRQNLHLVKA